MTDWMQRAACRGMDPNVFHPVDSNGLKPSAYKLRLLDAMFVCLSCPVANQCDQYATRSGIKDGVWAGRDRRNPNTQTLTEPQTHCIICDTKLAGRARTLCSNACRQQHRKQYRRELYQQDKALRQKEKV